MGYIWFRVCIYRLRVREVNVMYSWTDFLTWSINPLSTDRCFEGYVAKIPAVAFFPTTSNSPWPNSRIASGGFKY